MNVGVIVQKKKTEQVEDLHKLIDDLMAELVFHKVDEEPRPQKLNATPKVKTIKCCPECYGGNLVRGMKLNYDKKHDLLYIKLKDCPNHYVDQLEDKYFDLWRDSETDEVVGAHIWNASEWFRAILRTTEEHTVLKK